MNNKINNKTGEDLLASIANSMSKLPNISYLASVVQNIKDVAITMVGATATQPGVGGFVPTPPALNQTGGSYGFLGSDGEWHTQVSATLQQSNFNRTKTSAATTENKVYLLGAANDLPLSQDPTSINISTVQNASELYATSYVGRPLTVNGILNSLQDDDIGNYYAYNGSMSGEYMPLINGSQYVNRLVFSNSVINTYTEKRCTNEFLLGKHVAIVSNSTEINSSTAPRAAIVLGNLQFNASAAYKPFLIKAYGNSMKILHATETGHYIGSTYDTTLDPNSTMSKWIFSSMNRFRFNNFLEVVGKNAGDNVQNIATSGFNLDSYCTFADGTVKGSFTSANEIKFLSNFLYNNRRYLNEFGLYSGEGGNDGYLFRTANINNGITIAKYEVPNIAVPDYSSTYSKIKLAAFLKLDRDLYISTNTDINGVLSIKSITADVSDVAYRQWASDNFSTHGNFMHNSGQTIDIKPPTIDFIGPYNGFETYSYPTPAERSRNGDAKFFIKVNNLDSSSSSALPAQCQTFSICSYNTSFSEATNEIFKIYRANSTSASQIAERTVIIINAENTNFNNKEVSGVNKLTSTNILSNSITKSSAAATLVVRPTTIAADSSTQTVAKFNNKKPLYAASDTTVVSQSGNVCASGTLSDLPVDETTDDGVYWYRPIIVTKSSSLNDKVRNAKNGYIWAYTG